MPRNPSKKKSEAASMNTEQPITNTTPKKEAPKRAKVEDKGVAVVAKRTTPRRAAAKKDAIKEEGESDDTDAEHFVQSAKRKIKQVTAKAKGVVKATPTATGQSKKRKAEKVEDEQEASEEAKEEGEKKLEKKKRKTKDEKEAEAMPLAARTVVGSLKKAMHIGAHVSAAGGVHNSINNALHIGGNAFALFLKSQRKWTSPPLDPSHTQQFLAYCNTNAYEPAAHILPHGSYLVNLAQADEEKAQQAYTCFLDDLQRCAALGIRLYNFHPGNTGGNPRGEAIARIAGQLNKAHAATMGSGVVTVLENMAGSGNVVGSTWEDLRDIISLVEDKDRVGVCIDTCHAFAAGYDLRYAEAFQKTLKEFDDIVGIKYLKALHLNDSKTPLGSHRDLHANIGTGFLGLRAFWNVVNEERFVGLPMVLETPIERKSGEKDGKGKEKTVEDKGIWAREIKLLEGLVGADLDGEVFKRDEERLAKEGEEERRKFQGQVDKKKQKTLMEMLKKQSPKKENRTTTTSRKRQKKGVGSEDEDEDESQSEGGCNH